MHAAFLGERISVVNVNQLVHIWYVAPCRSPFHTRIAMGWGLCIAYAHRQNKRCGKRSQQEECVSIPPPTPISLHVSITTSYHTCTCAHASCSYPPPSPPPPPRHTHAIARLIFDCFQGLKKKVDNLLEAGKLFVVDQQLLDVSQTLRPPPFRRGRRPLSFDVHFFSGNDLLGMNVETNAAGCRMARTQTNPILDIVSTLVQDAGSRWTTQIRAGRMVLPAEINLVRFGERTLAGFSCRVRVSRQ